MKLIIGAMFLSHYLVNITEEHYLLDNWPNNANNVRIHNNIKAMRIKVTTFDASAILCTRDEV